MLISLHIENVAVIERADIEFSAGFNVMTGETGAGKSIVIDSLSSVLGARTSHEIIRKGADKASISAVFHDSSAISWGEENDIDCTDEIILQRKITADGKSQCRVNGTPVTSGQLKALGSLLLDIHGQNDGRQLLDEGCHLSYLDIFAGVSAEKQVYTEAYGEFQNTKSEISRLNLNELERAQLSETLEACVTELEGAKLSPGEERELEERRSLLKNSGKLTEALDSAYEALYAGDTSAIGLTVEACDCAGFAASFSAEMKEISKTLTDARYMLEDAAERVDECRRSLDFSPEEYDEIESRLALIKRLTKKYSRDEAGLIDLIEESRQRLSDIECFDERHQALEKKLNLQRAEVLKLAQALSEKRHKMADEISARVEDELKYLSMPSARFQAEITAVSNEDGFNANGCDEVRFLMSANVGEAPGRISKIASGGELSRIMLAMKSVFAMGDTVQSMVFDEIDTGVSGIAAQRVGEKMSALSASKQIICITHLPQIAALSDVHFVISKQESDNRTYTSVDELDRQGRVNELARLHGGDAVSEATLLSAREQLAAAERFKRGPSI